MTTVLLVVVIVLVLLLAVVLLRLRGRPAAPPVHPAARTDAPTATTAPPTHSSATAADAPPPSDRDPSADASGAAGTSDADGGGSGLGVGPGPAAAPRAHYPAEVRGDGGPGGGIRGEIPADAMARARRLVEDDLSQLRLEAVQSAAAARAEADTMAATTRRLAEAEADAVRRGARSEAEAIRAAVAAEAEKSRRQAELDVSTTLLEARRQAERDAAEITETARTLKQDLDRRESRLAEREERVDATVRRVEQRTAELTETEQSLTEREARLAAREGEHERELERIGGLTAVDARAELLKAVEERTRRDAAILVRDLEAEARGGRAAGPPIIINAIQRVASEQTAESVVSVLHLPSDEMKGRIIGREGRNIRAFESITGVNLIIDDTPEAVMLSCFDPVRREIGRITLENLVLDGRIHPHRIEEVYERSKERSSRPACAPARTRSSRPASPTCTRSCSPSSAGCATAPSYGQNVLKHLVETAHIAGMMAAELGLEPTVIKRGGFLHDIGKALTHEVEGSHALVGAELARKYGESEEVAHAIEAHHNEVAPRTIAAVVTQASDAMLRRPAGCSPGEPRVVRQAPAADRGDRRRQARRGRVFAMQAGREVRVMVLPGRIDDVTAQMLARDIAQADRGRAHLPRARSASRSSASPAPPRSPTERKHNHRADSTLGREPPPRRRGRSPAGPGTAAAPATSPSGTAVVHAM